MNRGNTDMTMEMSEATLPIIYINNEGQHINPLHGYIKEMNVSSMYDTVTPISASAIAKWADLSLY